MNPLAYDEYVNASKGKVQKRPKARKEKGSRRGNRKERALRDRLLLDLLNPRLPEPTDLHPNPSLKLDHAWLTVSCSL